MKFLQTFSLKSGTSRDEAIARYKKTGGQPPHGVQLLGRWINADFSGGVTLLESNDPQALTEYSLMWSDLVELKIVPVLDDRELSSVLERSKK